MKIYKVWLVNFQYYLETEFLNIVSAVEGAKGAGYTCTILEEDMMSGEKKIVATLDPISGLKCF